MSVAPVLSRMCERAVPTASAVCVEYYVGAWGGERTVCYRVNKQTLCLNHGPTAFAFPFDDLLFDSHGLGAVCGVAAT